MSEGVSAVHEIKEAETKETKSERALEESLKMAHVSTFGTLLLTRKFYESRNKLDMAIEIYDEILKEHPTNWEALSHKALCCHELGKHTGSCDFYLPDSLKRRSACLKKL